MLRRDLCVLKPVQVFFLKSPFLSGEQPRAISERTNGYVLGYTVYPDMIRSMFCILIEYHRSPVKVCHVSNSLQILHLGGKK